MRDIKFRAWLPEQKTIGLVTQLLGTNHTYQPESVEVEYYYDLEGMPRHQFTTTSSFELMQYIGLKDKNGVEIYEGDIIRSFEGNYLVRWFDYDEDAFSEIGTSVNYPHKAAAVGFGFEQIMDDKWYGYDHRDFKLCYFRERTEVIGNMWENPELLNPKQSNEEDR